MIGSKVAGLIKSIGISVSANRAVKVFGGILIIPVVLLITSSVYQFDQEKPDPDPQKELESFHIDEGFDVTLFASEPMVVKPIQMNWDADGRLWVASSTAYPHLKTGAGANDKIYVLEDTDGDGKADKSTVFADGLLTPTGILPGDGGVYVANSTEILFLSDTDGDGKADKKRVLLSGFGTADVHHLIHTFRWGPDGLLYFNQSIYIYSHVETPFGVKRLEGGGVWQLNPQTLELNVYAKGLVNPWGLEFDRWGQSFLTDGAGGEGINYGFPGATFLTSPGAERIIRGLNPGQPKHSGITAASGRHLPESWMGSVITNDFRANRINRFKLEEQGSGYASKQMGDLLWTDNVAFRPVDISIGPDGAIYVADWYNPIIQHGEVDFYDPRRDQEHGRIWRITAKNRPLVKPIKFGNASINILLDALKLPEDLARSQAKQVLKERGAKEVIPALEKWVKDLDAEDPEYEHNQLEALWVYQALNVVNEPLLLRLLNAEKHNARSAALRVLGAWYDKVGNVSGLLSKAVADKHPQVRLEAVIALRKLNTPDAERTALTVLEQPMDEFLDFALWQTTRELEPLWMKSVKSKPDFLGDAKKTVYALKSISNADAVTQLVQLYKKGQVPEEYEKDVLGSIGKSGTTADLNILFEMAVQGNAKKDKNVAAQLGVLEDAVRQRSTKPDEGISRIAGFIQNEDEAVATSAIRLIGLWKLEALNGQLVSQAQKGNLNIKKAALGALAAINTDASKKLLTAMTGAGNSTELRLLATAQLVSLDVKAAGQIGVALLKTMPAQTDATELIQAFIANKEGVSVLAKELGTQKIPEGVAKSARKILQQKLAANRHKDADVKQLKKALEASGGTLAPERTPQQPTDEQIAVLAKETKGLGNPEAGEMVYRKSSCFSCHALGGAGGRIGPDLSSLGTSSPVETIIRSVLYPNASIKEGFELKRVAKKDGSETLGYLVSDGLSAVVIRDVTGKEVTIAKTQINAIEKVPGSLMPPGLTANLEKQDFLDLISYLSKIGESGPFRVPNERFVRRWRTVSASKELTKALQAGLDQITKDNSKVSFQPIYSKVSGELPIDELPVVELNSNKRYSFVKFELEVLTKGNVKLGLNSTTGVTAWADQLPLKLSDAGVITNLSQGIHQITVAIDRGVQKDGQLRIQLQDAESSAAQTRLVMGQ